MKEDVYVAQIRLQEELEELFAAIDKAKGQATGFIPKARRGAACMNVGGCGGWWVGKCFWGAAGGWGTLEPGGQRWLAPQAGRCQHALMAAAIFPPPPPLPPKLKV